MYKVSIKGVEKEIEAEGVSVDKGTIIFFCDKECTLSKFVVNAGQWEYIEVIGDSDALCVRAAQPQVQAEAPQVVVAEPEVEVVPESEEA